MDDTLIRGDTTELQCILALQERGYYCSIPFSGSCRYDVVVDINNHLYRIQCKSSSISTREPGVIQFNTCRSTTNTKKTIRYSYSKEEIDYFYTYWEGNHFLIPVEETSQTSKSLRLKTPKQGIQSQMSIASDYLMDNIIKSIISGNPIEKYAENCIISIDNNGEKKLWSLLELSQKFEERQIRYIKECAAKNKMGYSKHWCFKEFPEL